MFRYLGVPEYFRKKCITCSGYSGLYAQISARMLFRVYQVRFFEIVLGMLGALCMGNREPLVRYLCTT